jgi:hypothetical protein
MLRRSLLLSLLIASATCGADDVPAGEPIANAATPDKPARSAPAPARSAPSGAAQDKSADDGAATAKAAEAGAAGGDKTLSGMSILGNQEAPKALVIVPWKTSEIGDGLGLDESLDDSRRPVDKEVFMRELDYYEIRSGSK